MADTQKHYRRGTHRTVEPSETLRRWSRFRRPMGITRLADVTGLDEVGIPVVQCVRPNSRSVSVSQGKGLDRESAAVSALMESIEGYHAERVELPLRLGSWAELRHRHRLADVTRLVRSEGSRFHADASILWVAGVDLTDGKERLLPFDTVNNDYRVPYPTGAGCFVMSSNGLASGNHVLEAISHGLCELIERDALSLASVAPATVRRVDPASIDAETCRWLLDRFERAGLDVLIKDVTSDLGLPAFDVTIVDREPGELVPGHGAGGAGAHPSAEVALCRALTEAAQSRVTVIAGSRDDMAPSDYASWGTHRSRRWQPEDDGADLAVCSFADRPSIENDTIEEDVDWMVAALGRAGLDEVMVVDLTRPEFGIPVVKVVVPGLECAGTMEHTTYGERARRAATAALTADVEAVA